MSFIIGFLIFFALIYILSNVIGIFIEIAGCLLSLLFAAVVLYAVYWIITQLFFN